ncbi:MAG: hypothetical protein ACI8RZ_002727 [Myxococcota bacterium]|jgi:hypothetical protein
MGLICTVSRTHHLPLPTRCLVGRTSSCTLQIPDRLVSSEHARIAWDGERWTVRDLGSTNGTWVADRQLRPGETVPLHVGGRLAFGDLSLAYILEDASPPAPIARCPADGRLLPARDGVLALPDEDAPRVLVFEDAAGSWVLEQEGISRPVADGHSLTLDDETWVLHLPGATEPTIQASRAGLELSDIALHFQVSSDEERVLLTLRHREGAEEVPARAHLYTLLTLARLRINEPDRDGWIYADALQRMLGIDEMRLNVDVYRCRRALGRLGIRGAAGIIERHRGTRQLRCGVTDIAVGEL